MSMRPSGRPSGRPSRRPSRRSPGRPSGGIQLRYGLNPHQTPASAEPTGTGPAPVRVIHGQPSYVNLLDALAGWRLVREAATALGAPAAASVKHVSPAGAAVDGRLDEVTTETFGVDGTELSPLARAYLRARDTDPRSSYGDLVAVSDPVDAPLASLLRGLACDGIVAPGYEAGTTMTLAAKKGRRFLVLEADPSVSASGREVRDVAGMRLVQAADTLRVDRELLGDVALPAAAVADVLLGLVVVRHTQSNAVAYLRGGRTLGVGAGQQSRIDGTRLAGRKAGTWWLRRHETVRRLRFRPGARRQDRISWQTRVAEGDLTPDEQRRLVAALDDGGHVPRISEADRAAWLADLTGVTVVSDGAIPFRDNVDHAARYGVGVIAEPGGSARSAEVAAACAEYGITWVPTGVRLFQH